MERFKSVILINNAENSGFNISDFNEQVTLIEYDKAVEFISVAPKNTLYIAYKPNDFELINAIIQNIDRCKLAMVIDEKNKEQAMSLLKVGLLDFIIADGDDVSKLNFQLLKWREIIIEREHRLKVIIDQHQIEMKEVIDELESFSYSVSHDLRAPLRAITGFSGILMDEYYEKLDTEGKRYINIIQKGTGQMSMLIDELLSFSRVGRIALRKSIFDPTTMVNNIVSEAHAEFGKDFNVTIDKLEPIYGDAGTIKQVFSNLIRNAFKFSSKVEYPTIKIGCELTNNTCLYKVVDNGIGFDMRYVDKLFKVFQRLHTNSDFEGSGVGLAIVDRIVKKHGGKVQAESPLEGGAKFCFWLPVKSNHT